MDDVFLEEWLTKTSMPAARRYLTSSVVNGIIYVIGGFFGSTTDKVEAYNPATDTWSTKANMPTARNGLTSSVVNGIIYVIGSRDLVVEAYNPATDTWSTKANMPTARLYLTSSVVNGIIYVIGGTDTTGFISNTVEAYNPATDTWSTKANMPTYRYGLTSSVVNGIIYVIGGGDLASPLNKVEAYNPVTDTWSTKANMPTYRYLLTSSVVNGIIYVIGGLIGSPANEVEAYDPATDAWSAKANMPTARYGLTSSAVNGIIYVIGGYAKADTNVVEAYSDIYTPSDVVEFNYKLAYAPSDVVEFNYKLAYAPSDVVEFNYKLAYAPSDVAEFNYKLAYAPSDVVEFNYKLAYAPSDVAEFNYSRAPLVFSDYIYDIKSEKKLLNRPKTVSRNYKSVHEAYCQWISDFSLQSIPLSEDLPATEIPFSLALLEATIFKVGFSNKSGIYILLSDVPALSSLKYIDSAVDSDLYTLRNNIPSVVFSKLLNQDNIYAAVNCKYALSDKSIMFYIECYKIEVEEVTKEYTYIGAFALKMFKNSDTDKGHMEIVFSSKVNPQNSYGLFEFNEDKNTSIVVPDNVQFFSESVEVDKVYSYSTIPTYNFVSSAAVIKDIATGKPMLSKPSKVSHSYSSALDAYDKWKIVGNFSSASESSLLSDYDMAATYPIDNNLFISASSVGKIGFTSENGLHIYLNEPLFPGQPALTLNEQSFRHYFGLVGSPSIAILFKNPNSDSKSYNGKYRSIPDGFIMFCQFSHYSGSNYRVDVAIKITKGGAIEIVTSAVESGTYLGFLCCNQSTGNYTKSISEANGGFEVALAANTVECYKSEAYKEFVEEPLNKPSASLTLYNGGEFVISSDGTPNIHFYKNSELNHLKLFFDFVDSESEMYSLFSETFGDTFIDEIENNKTVKLTNGSYIAENFSTVNTRKVYTYRNLDYLKFFKYDLFYVDSNNVQTLISQNNSSTKIKFPDLYFKSVGDKKFRIKLFFNEQGPKEYFYEKEFIINCKDNPTFDLPQLNVNNSLKFSIGSYDIHLKTYQYRTLLVDEIINAADGFNINKLFYRKKDSLNPFDSLEIGSEFSFSKILSGSEVIDSVTEFNFNFEHFLEVYEPNSDKLDKLSIESSIDNLVFLPQSYYGCDVSSTYANSVILDKLPELFTTKLKTTPLFFYFSYVGKIDELKLIDEFRNDIEHLVESKDLLNHTVYFNPLKDRTYYCYHKGFYKIVKYHTISEPFETEYKISNYTPLEFDTPVYFDKLYSDKTVSLKLIKPDGSVLVKEIDSDVSHVNSLISRIEYYENNGSSVILTNSVCPYYQKNSKYIFEKNVEDLFYTAKLVKDYNIPPNSVLSNNKCYAVEDGKLIEVEDGYIVSSLNENIYSYYNPHNKVTYNNKSKVFGYFVPKNTSEKLINLFNKNFKTVGTPIFKK